MKVILKNSSLVFQEATPAAVATPEITITGNSVSISCATSGATIYYTLDGSTPSSSSGTTYSSAFTLSSVCTIKAIATKSGIQDSEVASENFEPAGTWETLTLSPVTGSYMSASGSTGGLEGCAYATINVNPSEQYKISTQLSGNVAIVIKNSSTVLSSIVKADNPEGMSEYGVLTDYLMTMPANATSLTVSTRSQSNFPVTIKKFVVS